MSSKTVTQQSQSRTSSRSTRAHPVDLQPGLANPDRLRRPRASGQGTSSHSDQISTLLDQADKTMRFVTAGTDSALELLRGVSSPTQSLGQSQDPLGGTSSTVPRLLGRQENQGPQQVAKKSSPSHSHSDRHHEFSPRQGPSQPRDQEMGRTGRTSVEPGSLLSGSLREEATAQSRRSSISQTFVLFGKGRSYGEQGFSVGDEPEYSGEDGSEGLGGDGISQEKTILVRIIRSCMSEKLLTPFVDQICTGFTGIQTSL